MRGVDGSSPGGMAIPSVEEVFDMHERGAFDAPDPEASNVAAQELPETISQGALRWAKERMQAVRAAGKRGTWDGRRDIRSRTFADRERPSFVGRYKGSCKVTQQLLHVEYGGLDPDSDIAGPSAFSF